MWYSSVSWHPKPVHQRPGALFGCTRDERIWIAESLSLSRAACVSCWNNVVTFSWRTFLWQTVLAPSYAQPIQLLPLFETIWHKNPAGCYYNGVRFKALHYNDEQKYISSSLYESHSALQGREIYNTLWMKKCETTLLGSTIRPSPTVVSRNPSLHTAPPSRQQDIQVVLYPR